MYFQRLEPAGEHHCGAENISAWLKEQMHGRSLEDSRSCEAEGRT
jgi:hypothetical protein